MRSKFNEQLEMLNLELIEMGALCEEAIAITIRALLKDTAGDSFPEQDTLRNVIYNEDSPLEKVQEIEKEINQKERDIERLCMKMLLRQQPVAGDLRLISSALKMITDIERIGDQAVDIAEISRFIDSETILDKIKLKEMAYTAIRMVTDSITAYVKKDLKLARAVIQSDDTVDRYFMVVRAGLISIIRSDKENSEQAVDLIMIAKYIERIADHSVNISQTVVYSITGSYD